MATENIDFNALGQAIDTTWGRSSTPKTASYSVKMSLTGGDRMVVSFAAIVNFGSERQMIEAKRAYASEAKTIIAAAVKRVKDIYKDITGESLSVKQFNDPQDVLEIISFNCHTAGRKAYYRSKVMFEIG